MARIRSIKPEFPHSESMGRVSRDARLTFIQLWTLADDVGRLRGNSRMLASLLFPYDDDARDLIEGWLTELERERCIVRYSHDGTSYIEILNWLIHQKIDHPSKSKLPEPSRSLAKPREEQREDLDLDLDLDPKKDVELHSTVDVETNGRHAAAIPGDVEQVFGHWQQVWGKQRAKLDKNRIKIIREALKVYPLEDLQKSISGYRNSPYHRGENDRKTAYDSIELFLRNAQHIDAGMAFAEKSSGGIFRGSI